MEDIDIEQQEPLPVDRDGRPLRSAGDEPDGGRKMGCCEKFQRSVSKWMLPADARSKYLERANCCPPPIFIILISIAELAVFIYYAVWKPQKQWVTLDEGIWKSRLTYKPECRQEAWRFISYMFVHAGVEHIVGNLVMQLLLGIPLELVHKGFEVGMVYLAGVLAGSLASSIFDPLSALVGASGGVYALIGGYFMNAVVNFREMIPLLGVFRILAIVIFGVLCGSLCRDRGRYDHRLRLLQCLQQEAAQRPTLLAVYTGICSLCDLRCGLQHLPDPSNIRT
uniref:rhomboid-related protein 2 isoform X2 n=1 Tax=Epinephelus lanceolatus TaxID=310571 RepID=UPI001448066C|nr:rhomboid-related protein 2 isoform X2 [Epinephelus lanceolatus]